MARKIKRNMGTIDRVVRGTTGLLMLLNGLRHLGSSPLRNIEAAIGGVFVVYSATGFDPLLYFKGASTLAGAENNLWNRFRAMLPGQGIKPILSQEVIPKKPLRPYDDQVRLSEALAIG